MRYPLAESMREALDALTLEGVLDGSVTMDDLRVSASALEAQAAIAAECARPQLAENLLRASELVDVPEHDILAIYNALRPGRTSREALESLASRIEQQYRASRCASLLREAAAAL